MAPLVGAHDDMVEQGGGTQARATSHQAVTIRGAINIVKISKAAPITDLEQMPHLRVTPVHTLGPHRSHLGRLLARVMIALLESHPKPDRSRATKSGQMMCSPQMLDR